MSTSTLDYISEEHAICREGVQMYISRAVKEMYRVSVIVSRRMKSEETRAVDCLKPNELSRNMSGSGVLFGGSRRRYLS